MAANPTSARRSVGRVLVLVLLCGCAAADAGLEAPAGSLSGPNPWAQGGQTGALLPPCGLTPAARAGDSIPGGDAGIVIHTDQCVGFTAAELELHDEDGLMVAFDLVPLTGDAVLLKPRSPLPPGVYTLSIAGMRMESVVADAPPALPTELGTLSAAPTACDARLELQIDPLLLEFLPQLKLSVSVDGEPDRTWFDYGTLDVQDGRAMLELPSCRDGQCLPNGVHTLHVTGELAGESGTLMPVDVDVMTNCLQPETDTDHGCSVRAAPRATGIRGGTLLAVLFAALLFIVRRARRSSA